MSPTDKVAFLKGSKDSDKFMEVVKDLAVSKSTIYFKINFIKILDKYPKLKKSSLSLNFFKDYAKTLKESCKKVGVSLNSSFHYF